MRIALVNPRKVLVPLKDYGKRNGHYSVYRGVRRFLEPRGWSIVGEGTSYLYVDPPPGVKKPFRLAVEIPTREQIEQIAGELYAERKDWSGFVGEWWGYYYPPIEHGGRGKFAHFGLGENSLWTAVVSWMPDVPEFKESKVFPVKA